MKRFSCIVVLFLSLLIIYSGAGVSVMHYCCAGCEMMQASAHASDCPKCKKDKACHSSEESRPEGCMATIYKPDLMQTSTALHLSIPMVDLWYKSFYFAAEEVPTVQKVQYATLSPPPICSRQMLSLYATLLI